MKTWVFNRLLTAAMLCGTVIVPAWAAPNDPILQLMQKKGLTVPPTDDAVQAPKPARSDLIVHAMAYVGLPYSWGGASFETGFDCSAFVQAAFARGLRIALPRTVAEQADATHVIEAHELTPGDLVFFNTTGPRYSHVGIYIGDGRFVHSPRSGALIRIESLHSHYWQRRLTGARRALLPGRA